MLQCSLMRNDRKTMVKLFKIWVQTGFGLSRKYQYKNIWFDYLQTIRNNFKRGAKYWFLSIRTKKGIDKKIVIKKS